MTSRLAIFEIGRIRRREARGRQYHTKEVDEAEYWCDPYGPHSWGCLLRSRAAYPSNNPPPNKINKPMVI